MQQPNNNQFQQYRPPMQQIPQVPRPRRRRRRQRHRRERLRWGLFVVFPLLLLVAIWAYNSISIGFSWDELLDEWKISDKPRFTSLALIGVCSCFVCAIARVLRSKKG